MSVPVVLCLCGCERDKHKGGKNACRICRGCDQFEPDDARERALIDAESTTAALARVTQERDYLLGVVEGMRRTIAELIAERDEALAVTITNRQENRP